MKPLYTIHEQVMESDGHKPLFLVVKWNGIPHVSGQCTSLKDAKSLAREQMRLDARRRK